MSRSDQEPPIQPSLFTVDPTEWEAAGLADAYPDIAPGSYLARLAMTNHEELQDCLRTGCSPSSPKFLATIEFGDTFERMYQAVSLRCARGEAYEDAVTATRQSLQLSLALIPEEAGAQGTFLFEQANTISMLADLYLAKQPIHSQHFAAPSA